MEVKRGYVKWTDKNGVKHKVRENEYKAVEELVEADTSNAEIDMPSDDGNRLL